MNLPYELLVIILNFCGLNQEPLNFKFNEGETLRSKAACLMALVFKKGSPIDQYLQEGYWRYLMMGWSRLSHDELISEEVFSKHEEGDASSSSNRIRYAQLMHKFNEHYRELHEKLYNSNLYSGGCDFKIFLGGKANVGKTAMTVQYVMNFFDGVKIEPTIQETTWKSTIVDGFPTRLVIEDEMMTFGEEYRTGECFMLVCSITDRESLNVIEEVLKTHFKSKKSYKSYVIVVNKIDEDSSLHEFNLKDIYEIFTRNPKLKYCPIIMTSAAQNDLVSGAFSILIRNHRLVQVIKSFETNTIHHRKKGGDKKCILC